LIGFIIGVLFTFLSIDKSIEQIQKTCSQSEFTFVPAVTLTRVRSPSFEQCGTWQEKYIAQHKSILNGSAPPRYLVFIAGEAGLSDRMIGALTGFYFSLLTNRAFQIITYGTLPRFEAAFEAPHINWSRRTDPDELIDNLKYTYRGKRGFIGDRSYGSHIDTNLFWSIYLMNNDQHSAFYATDNVSTYPIGHAHVPTVFMTSNRGRMVRLFDNPYHRADLFRMGLRPEMAMSCAWNFLFSPTPAVLKAMAKEFNVLKNTDILKIAINIRVGDHVFSPEKDASTKLESFRAFFNCAIDIETFARTPHQRVIWYLTSDSLRIRQLAKEYYGDKILTQDAISYVHGDCGDQEAKRYGNCTKTSQDSSIQLAAGQVWAISMCDYIVEPSISSFGRLGAWLGVPWRNVFEIHQENRSCSQGSYQSFEALSNIGTGI
jgi:hypothetical protein